jgi:hypothetical protein
MSTRLLLSGILSSPAARRKRRDNGALFAVATVRDTDRGQPRIWRAFLNEFELIERVEEMRTGEPIAVSGPFSVTVASGHREPSVEYRISVEADLDTKRKRKSKTAKQKEERITSDEVDQAPCRDGEALNDDLPF